MNKYIYCDKCGYNNEVKAILFDKCPKCNTPLIIDDIETDESIANILDEKTKLLLNCKSARIIRKRFKKDHERFDKMGKITDKEGTDFLIDLWR